MTNNRHCVKFKVGDPVMVSYDMEGGLTYDGLSFNYDMEEYIGRNFFIKNFSDTGYYRLIDADGFTPRWVWNDLMLIGITIDERDTASDEEVDMLLM